MASSRLRRTQGSVLGPILFIIYNNICDIFWELINILSKIAADTKMGKIVKLM